MEREKKYSKRSSAKKKDADESTLEDSTVFPDMSVYTAALAKCMAILLNNKPHD